jgi:adenylate kinase family enzyme
LDPSRQIAQPRASFRRRFQPLETPGDLEHSVLHAIFSILRAGGEDMKRVLILGPGASGKSTLAARLGEITGLPVVELDRVFWQRGLLPTPRDRWVERQQRLVAEDRWIIDGDLGPYDAVEVRLSAADTIIFLDFSFARCAWRALRRSRERADFWLWLWRYRRRSRPLLMTAIQEHATHTDIHVLHNPQMLRRFLAEVVRTS